MKVSYYPGCTVKTRAKSLDEPMVKSLALLGVEAQELERWNCCGATFSLADDNLLNLVAPIRNLIRVKEAGLDHVITSCSMCYNTLARANQVMREDEEKRDTLNLFMDEEMDYSGDVQVLHVLNYLQDHVGWDEVARHVKVPLNGMKVASYYGCMLTRPKSVSVDAQTVPQLFETLVKTLGGEVVPFPAAQDCCGSYQAVGHPDTALRRSAAIVDSAAIHGAQLIVSSCPLCEFNLGLRQEEMREKTPDARQVPTYYFTQILGLALGLGAETCHFDLNGAGALDFLKEQKLVTV